MSRPILSSTGDARELWVRVTIGFDVGGIEWFTPGRSMQVGRCRFEVHPPEDNPCDFWIVLGNAKPCETALVASANTLFIAGEPPAKKCYPKAFYRQFAHVIDTHAGSRHPGLVIDALGLFWMVGLSWEKYGYVFGYDHLKQLTAPEKINRVSVVCSNTASTAGQRRRLEFLHALKVRLGDKLVHFGKGFTPVDNKMEAVAPYRFHLVLENSQSSHYWTEKLTDAYLGWAFPLYVGCDNLGDYFSAESFHALDMDDVNGAVALIERMLATPRSPAEIEAVRVAREQVLDVYNPFVRFARWVERFHCEEPVERVTIRSEKAFHPFSGWLYRLKKR